MMKKTLHIVFAVILLFSLSACGKDNKISEYDKDGISNLANKKIECCDIFEYGEYVYYILPSEDNYLYDDVICRMKKDGTEKEVIVNKVEGSINDAHTMYVHENYLYYESSEKSKIGRINLDTMEEIELPFSKILHFDDEFMIYRSSNGLGIVKVGDINDGKFENKDFNGNIVYTDNKLIVYELNNKYYATTPKEMYSMQQGRFLMETSEQWQILLAQENSIYFYIRDENKLVLHELDKENLEIRFIVEDFYEDEFMEDEDQIIANIAIEGNTILYTIGSYQGSGGFWFGSTRKVNRDGTGKEILEAYNENDYVEKINNKLYYSYFTQERMQKWYEYVIEDGSSKAIEDFDSIRKEKYQITAKDNKNIVVKRLDGNDYKEIITITKRNDKIDFSYGEIKEVGEWLYAYIYETDYNVGPWRGHPHLEFYRISNDYKTVQRLDNEYVIKEPYSKVVALDNIAIDRGVNAQVKVTFVPDNQKVNLNKDTNIAGKYLIETFCQENQKNNKLEISNVLFNNEKVELNFTKYVLTGNPIVNFKYISSEGKSKEVKYEILADVKLKEIKELQENEEFVAENFFLYNGYEISPVPGVQYYFEGMEINKQNLLKYNIPYYNFENGKYIGKINGVFGNEGLVDGYSIVEGTKKIAFTEYYNAIPRTHSTVSTVPKEIINIENYSNVEMEKIDLDGDGSQEYILCYRINNDEDDVPNGGISDSSGIILFDSNYNKIANLCSFNIRNEEYVEFLSLNDVEYIDIDKDNIMEIIIDFPAYEAFGVGIFKYSDGTITGAIDYEDVVGP